MKPDDYFERLLADSSKETRNKILLAKFSKGNLSDMIAEGTERLRKRTSALQELQKAEKVLEQAVCEHRFVGISGEKKCVLCGKQFSPDFS